MLVKKTKTAYNKSADKAARNENERFGAEHEKIDRRHFNDGDFNYMYGTGGGKRACERRQNPLRGAGGRVCPRIEPVDGVAIAALSDVVDTIGAQCSFELSSKRVTLRFGKHCLRLSVGSSFAHENGGELTLQAPVSCKNGTILVPIEDVLAALNLGYYTDADTKTVFITRGAGEEPVPQDVKVPILMYHAVSDDIWGTADLFVSPSELEKQLTYLQENGYTTITFEDLPRIDEIEKPILLTFDDGYRDNYTELFRFCRNMRQRPLYL